MVQTPMLWLSSKLEDVRDDPYAKRLQRRAMYFLESPYKLGLECVVIIESCFSVRVEVKLALA